MLKTTSLRGRKGARRAFTLIELMVVILILGILVVIGLTALQGAPNKAKDKAAQSTARSALLGIQSYKTDHTDFTGLTNVTLGTELQNVTVVADPAPSTDQKTVSIKLVSTSEAQVAVLGGKDCWFVDDNLASASTETTFGNVIGVAANKCYPTAATVTYVATGFPAS